MPTPLDERDELRKALDEEISRLPETYRRPVVLCYLQGLTHDEAAHGLRCTTGAVRGRLDRAREKLKGRLARRGLAPTAAFLTAALAAETSSAAVPPALLTATLGLSRAATGSSVARLADVVIRSMLAAKLKLVAAGVFVLAALPVAFALQAKPGDPATAPAIEKPGRDQAKAVPPEDRNLVSGRALDSDGKPIQGARVALGSKPLDVPGAETTTDTEGRFQFRDIKAGEVIVTVQARGRAPELKRVAKNEANSLVFRLGPGQTVRGRIVDLKDKPIAGAPVSVGPWRGHHSLRWNSTTDAEGRFRWDEAPADEVYIDIGELGYTSNRFFSLAPSSPEELMKMPRPFHARGTVTDAETGKPIDAFTILAGTERGPGQPPTWVYDRAQSFSQGTYKMKLGAEQRNFVRVLKAEAPGYLPETSPSFLHDEENGKDAVVDFKLRRGTGIVGRILSPDGSPLVGAEIVVVRPDQVTVINNGQAPDRQTHRVITTDLDGRFHLPHQTPPCKLVVLHERGFAECAENQFAASGEVSVRPWGRVEGTLRIGTRPGAGESLHLQHIAPGDRTKTTLFYEGRVTADASGDFALERVVPGVTQVNRILGKRPNQTVYSHHVETEVLPGGTAHVSIGGTGRPLVGRVSLPDGIAGSVDWAYSTNYIRSRTPGLTPPPGLDAEGRKAWFAAWSRTDEGKEFRRRQHRHYAVRVESDGTFRVEDVDSGDYEVILGLDNPPDDPSRCSIGSGHIATGIHPFTVPEIPGGRGDEPLDLGTIALKPTRAPSTVKVGEPAPAFHVTGLDDKPVNLADFRGKYVLLDFWATWCGPCLKETPHLKAAFEAFGEDERFALIGLSLDPSKDEPRDYATRQGLSWPQGFLGEWSKTKLPEQFGIWGIPSIWLIGPDGKVIAKDLRGEKIEAAVAEALGKRR